MTPDCGRRLPRLGEIFYHPKRPQPIVRTEGGPRRVNSRSQTSSCEGLPGVHGEKIVEVRSTASTDTTEVSGSVDSNRTRLEGQRAFVLRRRFVPFVAISFLSLHLQVTQQLGREKLRLRAC